MQVIREKWVYKNKLDEHGNITKNKAQLVAKGYSQEEGIDYDETYDPIARLEAIRILLAYASIMNFKLYQMDVNGAFFKWIHQRRGLCVSTSWFEDYKYPNHVYCKTREI